MIFCNTVMVEIFVGAIMVFWAQFCSSDCHCKECLRRRIYCIQSARAFSDICPWQVPRSSKPAAGPEFSKKLQSQVLTEVSLNQSQYLSLLYSIIKSI